MKNFAPLMGKRIRLTEVDSCGRVIPDGVHMTMDGLVGSRLYYYLDLSWMTDLQRDQFVGGVAAWAVDEAAIALVTLGLVLHWAWQNRDEDSEPELL